MTNDSQAHAKLLSDSFRKLTGRPLFEITGNEPNVVQLLNNANAALVSHGTEDDPIFNYANKTALNLFEMSWEAFTSLPSRLSAEPVHQDERARLMKIVASQGFIDDYAGVRISRTGKRFRIESATVWNLVDTDGVYRGQAATFSKWHYLEQP